jgi:hypothetical protein
MESKGCCLDEKSARDAVFLSHANEIHVERLQYIDLGKGDAHAGRTTPHHTS